MVTQTPTYSYLEFRNLEEGVCLNIYGAAQVVRTVTDAVAYLHEHNIVHRDIKVSPLYIYLYTHSILGCRHQQ